MFAIWNRVNFMKFFNSILWIGDFIYFAELKFAYIVRNGFHFFYEIKFWWIFRKSTSADFFFYLSDS